MEATLSGAHFDISPNDPLVQAVGTNSTVRWTWDVVPKTAGKLTLHLIVAAVIDVDGQPVPTVVQTFNKDIVVQVTVSQRLSHLVGDHWEWLLTTLAIPLGVWARNKWKRRAQSVP